MSKIYLPSEYVDMPCKVVNNGYIRVYSDSSYNTYYDIYVNQDYMIKQGNTSYTQNIECDSINEYTDAYYYRLDIDKIFIVLFIFLFICYFIMKKIIRVFFFGFREA